MLSILSSLQLYFNTTAPTIVGAVFRCFPSFIASYRLANRSFGST